MIKDFIYFLKGLYFQEAGAVNGESIIVLHDYVMIYLIGIIIFLIVII
jgi:hypothetical protein